jgi:endothelin-converting enzyme/putative endopeptidase
VSSSGLQLDALDKSADACTDFYQFACGGWIARNPVPADRSGYGRFDELSERNTETLHRILEAAASGRDPESKKIGDYYASCLDEPAIDAKGGAPLDPLLRKIAALSSVAELAPLVAELHTIGVNVFFQFGSQADFKDASVEMAIVDQGGLGLPDRDYYFKDDPKSVELRTKYLDHVGRMSALLGAGTDQAGVAARQAVALETALAKGALDAVSRRDPSKVYHKMSTAELQALTPQFMWSRYFSGIGSPPVYALNVAEPDFVKAVGQIVATTPLEAIKAYLRWQLANASAPLLAKPFVDENFRFYGTALTGATELRPRWKRCVQFTDSDLGEALGQAFIKEAFGPQAKADTLKMVHELEAALEADIDGLAWMTPATRKEALVKLHAVADKIGYPDHWRDYGALNVVRGDALGNSQRANAFEFHRQMNKIGKPVNKEEWAMTPPTVNAYYNPLENNINFPAGILQPPFYSAGRDAALNYGAAGAVIGHELTHGFDDQGRKIDADGGTGRAARDVGAGHRRGPRGLLLGAVGAVPDVRPASLEKFTPSGVSRKYATCHSVSKYLHLTRVPKPKVRPLQQQRIGISKIRLLLCCRMPGNWPWVQRRHCEEEIVIMGVFSIKAVCSQPLLWRSALAE